MTLLIAACSTAPAADALPSGSLAPIAASAKATLASDVVDTHFDVFAARLGLSASFGARGDVILEQLRRTRAAVATARATSSRAGGSRAASVRAAIPSLFSVPLFAQSFAAILDLATSHAVNEDMPTNPLESSEEDAASHTRTTTALRTAEHVSSSGSRVTYSMTWTYRMTAVDTTSGAQLLDSIDERTLVGTIDVCPDTAGNVPATLDAHAVTGATKVVNGSGQQVRSESKSDNGFTGSVDDAATLRSVKREFKEQASWQNASGTGSYETTMSATQGATGDGGIVGGALSGFTGTFTANGDAGGVDPSKATAWTFAVDMWAMDEPFKAAQRLWRNGRCVMVVAPDYGAETPKNVGDQTKAQHDESVDRGSETKFGVNTKHRFAGTLSQSVVASISGDKKLEPSKLESMPGQLTYTAPDEEDKKATATLRSTSKRGIGTLVLDFHTGGPLILSIQGTATSHQSFLGTTSDQTFRVAIGPLEFKSMGIGDVVIATGAWQSTFHSVTANSVSTQTCDGSEKGTIDMEAQVQTRGATKVYVIEPISMSSADGAGTMTCQDTLGGTTLRGVTFPREFTAQSDGGSASVFLGALDRFEVPASGGTVAVRGSRNIDRMAISAQGTATARTTK